MGNARLIEALDASRAELAERADVERIAARDRRPHQRRHRPAGGPPARRRRGRPPAPRRRRADRPDRPDVRAAALGLRLGRAQARRRRSGRTTPTRRSTRASSGQAVVSGRPFWTGDYAQRHALPARRRARTSTSSGPGIHSVMAAPLIGEGGPFGALTVFSSRADAWGEADAALLEAIADQAAIAIRTTRLIDELDRSRERARPPGRGRAGPARDRRPDHRPARPGARSSRTSSSQAGRLVGADGVILDLLDPATGNLHWAFDDGLSRACSPPRSGRSSGSRSASGATGDRRRRGPGRHRRRRPRVACSRRRPSRPSSTSAPGSTR